MKRQRDVERGAHKARGHPLSGNGRGVAASGHNQGQGSFLRRVSLFGAAGAILIALLGLLGYVPGLGLLGSVHEGYVPMAPSTAISFIVLGGVLLWMTLRSLSDASLVLFGALAALVSLFGALEVGGHFTGRDLNFEDALVPSAGYLGEIPIARMSPATGAAFLLAGLAVLAIVLRRSRTHDRGTRLGHWGGGLGSLVLGIGLLFCLAYIFGSPLLYGRGATVPMALTTALAFLMLGGATVGVSGEEAIPVSLLAGAMRAGKPLSARKRFLFLALIMVGVCAMVMVVMTVVLYHQDVQEYRSMLQVIARSQARLIEAVARYDVKAAGILRDADPGHDASAATLSQIINAHEHYEGFGETGEFMLAQRDGDSIVFILRHRHGGIEHPPPVALDSDLAEPMRRAMEGLSGIVIGLDYRGKTVLAAHEPVGVLNLGIVAKIDLSEIRAPYIRSGLAAAVVAFLVILAGTALFFRVGNPIIERLEAYSQDLEMEVEDRKQAEEGLRESEERFRSLFENAPLGYQSLNENGDFIELNETWCKLLGYTKEEVLGRNFSEFIHPDFGEHFKENFPKFKSMGYILGVEFEMIKKDGSEITVAFNGRIAHHDDGRFKQTHCVFNDITERKRAEESLLAEKLLSDEYINSLPGLFYVFDEQRFVRWNREWENVTGYNAEELGARYGTDFFDGEDQMLIEDRMRKVFRE